MQVALAWLLHRPSSVAHLLENLAAAQLSLSPEMLGELDTIAMAAETIKDSGSVH